jgi:hypothetical protein
MVSCPSCIHHQLASFFVSNPRHHTLLNASAFICGTALLPNDDVLPTADASTECFEENLLPNGVLLPNSAHMSVSSLYQFLVLTMGQLNSTRETYQWCWLAGLRHKQSGTTTVTRNNIATISGGAWLNGGELTITGNTRSFAMSNNTRTKAFHARSYELHGDGHGESTHGNNAQALADSDHYGNNKNH